MAQFEFMSAYDPRKFIIGTMALDGSNPTVITTGLRVVDAVSLTLNSAAGATPGDGASVLTYDIVAGVVNVYAWQNTTGTDPTLVASTDTDAFSFIIVGRE